ncbi:MAG: PEP-CTERM sorting domain-containing protein [Bryobacteraceae bacterium]
MNCRFLSAIAVVSFAVLSVVPASAAVLILTDPVVTPNGPSDFTWTWDVYLGPNSRVNTPGGPCNSAVPGGTCDGLLTIYDFTGYIPGSVATTMPNWSTGPIQLLGITPVGLTPDDDPAELNLSWRYTGSTTVAAPLTSALLLGTVSARSTSGLWKLDDYAGRTAFGTQNQRSANLDITKSPASVPEPGTFGLVGAAALGLLGLRRRFVRDSSR